MAVNDDIPKSRITLTYRTTVRGEKEEVQLPFRMLVMGDLSRGTSTDRKKDLDQRGIRNLNGKNLDEVISDMDMKLELTIPSHIGADKSDVKVTIPIKSMKSFEPAEVAQHIPKIKSLLLLKRLLLEVQGNLDNRKDFRRVVRALAADSEAMAKIRTELTGFEGLVLPTAPKNGEPDANTPS